MLKKLCRLPIAFALVTAVSFTAYGQVTVNVSPGDDITAALREAGADGTVIFAPGWYQLEPATIGTQYGITLTAEHAGITLQGAGPGTDPATATILDGEGWFLATGFRIESFDVVIDGFTVINMWDEAFEPAASSLNIEIRNCWALGCDSGADNSGNAGAGTEDDFSDMIRYINCIFARGGDDASDQESGSALLFRNCDFYDWDSDIMDHDGSVLVIVQNSIFHAGSLSDDLHAAGGILDIYNSVFWDPKGGPADGPGGIQLDGGAIDYDSVEGDPLYVNVGPSVHYLDLDFHLQPGSPALTAGRDANGNPTFAGALGPQ